MQLFKLLNFKKLVCVGLSLNLNEKKKRINRGEKEVKLGVHKADWLGIMFLTLKPVCTGNRQLLLACSLHPDVYGGGVLCKL